MPTLYVIGGPNGVGKTTFVDQYLPYTVRQLEFVNADLISRGLSPYDPESAALEAGRLALVRIRHLIAEQQSFTWETTLSGRTAVGWLNSAKKSGYQIKCYFLWVKSVETTLKRIRQRVAEGGHNIELEVSRRRFYKTVQNFFSVYRGLFDSWKLIECNDGGPRLLALEKGGRLIVRDQAALDNLRDTAGVDYET